MKDRVIYALAIALVCMMCMTACESPDISNDGADLDLTLLSETMLFGEVNQMMLDPDAYTDKIVRVGGTYQTTIFEGVEYHACVFTDSTACCTQVFEFVPKEGTELPPVGTPIEVTGRFEAVIEGGVYIYLTLFDADVEAVGTEE